MAPTPSSTPGDPTRNLLDSWATHFPSWLHAVYILLVPTAVWLLLPQQVVGGLRWIIARVRARRSKVDRRRADRRGRFASAMASQVARISEGEEWRDERFAELEAEVEIHGRARRGSRRRGPETVRRVSSLSVALEESSDSIILLEGEPGAGKSVAMRHLAIRMATRGKEQPSENGVIPVYVNLKEFRPDGEADVRAVLAFVKESVNRLNDVLVERFIDEEFERGVEEGTWLFLFDSFDEIPAVLSAVEADEVIERYASALYAFMTGMSACRGIIATREFRGPKRINWPRFRVLPLTDKQRRDLVRKLDISADAEEVLLGELAVADNAIRQMANNPLFLALLCEHQRHGGPFPKNSHVVFEDYIARRLRDDSQRVERRFGLTSTKLRDAAERVAFAMGADPGEGGLSPTRPQLLDAMRHHALTVDDTTDKALDALEYIRLARTTATLDQFTFAHRRFQEYFATCLVLREPTRINPMRLLTDGRWRETAVTLLQTTDDQASRPILREADRLLESMVRMAGAEHQNVEDLDDLEPRSPPLDPFAWPAGSIHLLGLLQSGLGSGSSRLTRTMQDNAGRLICAAFLTGQRHDQRWAVDVCLVAGPTVTVSLLRRAFASGSGWLREAAYEQTARLGSVPMDLRREMRAVLAGLAASGQLRDQWLAIEAQVRRLEDPRPELLLRRLFQITPLVDLGLLAGILTVAVAVNEVGVFSLHHHSSFAASNLYLAVLTAVAAHVALYLDRDRRRLNWTDMSVSSKWRRYPLEAVFRSAGLPGGAGAVVYIRVAFASLVVNISQISSSLPNGGSRFLLTSLSLLLVAYLAAWGPLAIWADRILTVPTVLQIALLPLTPLRRAPEILRNVHWSNARSLLTWPSPDTVAVMAILGAGATYIVGTALLSIYVSIWFTVLVVGPAAFGVLSLLGAAVRNILASRRDRRRLARMNQDSTQHTGFAEMLSAVDKFATEGPLLIFIQGVKRSRIALADPPTLRALQVIAARAQSREGTVTIFPQTVASKLNPDELAVALTWWTASIEKTLLDEAQAILDEIGKIMAEVELRKMTALPEP